MRKEDITVEKTKRKKNYLTTTELAEFCGVSSFTVRNWINRGKIRTIRTVGNQHRIPASEAISFLETLHGKTFHNDKKALTSGLLGHCWEHTQKTNCDKECGDCLIYGREIDYCFVVVRQFGKEIIRCKGNCLNCGYFKEFFSIYGKRERPEEACDEKSEETAGEKKNFLHHFAYGVGHGVHQLNQRDLRGNSSTVIGHKTTMRKSLSHLPEGKAKEIAYITNIILEELLDVQMVILFGSYARGNWIEDVCAESHFTYEYKSDFDILIITEDAENADNSDLHRKVEDRLKGARTTLNLILHDIQYVNSQLSEGQYFFSDIKKEGIMLYDSGKFKLAKRRKLNIKKRKEIAQRDFKKWFTKAKRFYNHFQYDLEKRWYNEAVLELYQSIECFYTAILLVFAGYKPKGHDIENLGKQIASYDPAFLAVFPCATEEQDRIFKLLKNAYIDARYKDPYKITKADLQYLDQRVKKLTKLATQICKMKMDSFV